MMHKHPYVVHGLKYATLTLAVLCVALGVSALLKNNGGSTLSGRLVSPQQQGITPTLHYNAQRTGNGFSVPPDTHVIFTMPRGSIIPRVTFFGGPDLDEAVKYWGYCFSGNEDANRSAGKQGKELYDGQYFFSAAELESQGTRPKASDSDLLGILHGAASTKEDIKESIAETLVSEQTCYVMTAQLLPAGLDADGDTLNDTREVQMGTNPKRPDSDNDGLGDGEEVFTTKTRPLIADTDDDGLADSCEDTNKNGQLDRNETSALVADTDRDSLCDGSGFAAGCPEPKQQACYQQNGSRVCTSRPSSPVYGEDMNQNCLVDNGETDPANATTFNGVQDWTYKYNAFQKNDTSTSSSASSVFPIPGLPLRH